MGQTLSAKIDPRLKDQIVTRTYWSPEGSPVAGIFAGADIQYGQFERTIYTQEYLFAGDWADPLRIK